MRKNILKRFLAVATTSSLLLNCTGCTSTTSNNSSKDKVSAFGEFCNELFIDEVTGDSISLNYTVAHPENFGITEHVIGYGDTDLTNLDDTSDLVADIKKLKSFNRAKLTESEQLDYDILLDVMTTNLEYSDLYLYDKTLSPTIGLNCQLPVVLAEFAFRTKADVEEYIELLETTDTYFQFILELEKMKADKGLFMTDDIADKVIEQCQNFTENPEENYLLEIFDDKIDAMDGYTDSERATLKERNKKAVLEHVIPAYDLLAEGLTKLKGTGKYEGGLCNYPDGNKYYEYLIRSGVGTKRSVEEIEKLIDSYVAKAYRKMGTAMRNNPNAINEADNVDWGFTDPYEILSDLQSRIDKEFPTMPEANYTIKYVHPSLEDHMSPAFYMVPAIDEYKDNVIYINRGGNSGNDIYTTLAHEGFPGHLYQTVYTNSCGLSPIRAALSYGGYTEGWATYIELLAYEMGAIDADLGALLSANQLIILAMYAKCDIGVNYHGWTQAEVSEYISTLFGSLDDSVIEEIYQAMVSEPANYLKYVVGSMEFMELRNTAETTLGDRFNPIDFHDFIMATGPAPFDIIRNRMDTWMQGIMK